MFDDDAQKDAVVKKKTRSMTRRKKKLTFSSRANKFGSRFQTPWSDVASSPKVEAAPVASH